MKQLLNSTTYKVSVMGINKLPGENATIKIDMPPQKPQLANKIELSDEVDVTPTTLTIIIPETNTSTVSNTR